MMNHEGAWWGDISLSAGASGSDRLTSTKPRLLSKLWEMCPFTASRAFQWATLGCCATVFPDRQLRTCFDGGDPAGPHIDLSAWWASAHHDLPSLAPSVAMEAEPERAEVGLLQLNGKSNFYSVVFFKDRLWYKPSQVIKPIAKSIIFATRSMHKLVSQKTLEKINIPQRKRRLSCMSSITHSHWAICNSHLSFEGSWALNREEFPSEGRICWNRPMIISILMAL